MEKEAKVEVIDRGTTLDPTMWGRVGDELIEVFYRSEDETIDEMYQAGYIPIEGEDDLWVCEEEYEAITARLARNS